MLTDIFRTIWSLRRRSVNSDFDADVFVAAALTVPFMLYLEMLLVVVSSLTGTPTLQDLTGNRLVFVVVVGGGIGTAVYYLVVRIRTRWGREFYLDYGSASPGTRVGRILAAVLFYVVPFAIYWAT